MGGKLVSREASYTLSMGVNAGDYDTVTYVARFIAAHNADVVDMGVPLLSMHAPFEIVAKLDSSVYPVRLYGEEKSKTLALCWENYDMDERGQKDVGVGEMPYKMYVSLNGKYLRDLLAMQPTEMRFVDSSCAVLFVGEDTLLLMMPLVGADFETCTVDKLYYSTFDMEK